MEVPRDIELRPFGHQKIISEVLFHFQTCVLLRILRPQTDFYTRELCYYCLPGKHSETEKTGRVTT